MAPELREGLCRLCRGHGWSYGVFWRVDLRDPRLLVMEDSYYEEQIGTVIDKMITQVHMVGEGTIGAAAISGKHQWIYSDTYHMESSPTSPSDNIEKFKGNAEWQDQFLAGVKTIAIISLPFLGVIQFDSTQKICESLEFINQVQHLFQQLGTMTGYFRQGDAYKALNVCDPYEAFASVVSSGDTCACYKSINSLHDVISRELQANAQSSTGPILSSSLSSLGSHNGTGSHSGSMDPHLLAVPVISSPTGASNSLSDPFQKLPSISSISSFHFTNQCRTSSVEAQVSLLPNHMWSNSCFPNNSFATNLNANTWVKEIATVPMPDQRFLSGMATNSETSIPHIPFHYFCEDSTSSHSPCGLQVMIHGSGKLLNFQHLSSSLSFPVDGLSTIKSSSKVSFAPELPDNFLTFPQVSTPEPSASIQFKDDQIHPCDQPSDQVRDDLDKTMKDSLVSVRHEAIGCTPTTYLPSVLVENPVRSAVNSLDTGCDWKESFSDAPTQLLDNDLFEGMDLDLSQRILGQKSWDDVLMPVSSGSCSNLSGSVSDCISDLDMSSMAVADEGLFSESSFEQLLEAVVGKSANLSSSHSSVPTDVSAVADLDSKHQVSTTTRLGCPQVYTKEAPLPEFNLEKIMQGSLKEALPKSRDTSWIDDNCSLNAGSAVTNQPKKPDETAKVVRKRARPRESTRPKPKDRQQVQDRVKELREIVPNGAKCSIDSLLDRTIKHMLFLQSVTKYADKLKQTDEPKMIGEENGVILKDNSGSSSSSGGATWAYEVAGQTMVCPVLVEDLNPPGQMLVEMLCEECEFFLEIADIICGFGLTILKGVMEIRESKIWAWFMVEANRDVSRLDIFLSLVQLLQQTSSIRSSKQQQTKAIDKGVPTTFTNYVQSPVQIPICLADRLQ